MAFESHSSSSALALKTKIMWLLCFAAAIVLTHPKIFMGAAAVDENDINPVNASPTVDLMTPKMAYFKNIAPSLSDTQVVILWFVMAFIIGFFLWAMGHSLYRGWKMRKQQELETALSDSARVTSDNSQVILPPISISPSAPPFEALTCHRCGYPNCNIIPSQLVCTDCGNMWPLN